MKLDSERDEPEGFADLFHLLYNAIVIDQNGDVQQAPPYQRYTYKQMQDDCRIVKEFILSKENQAESEKKPASKAAKATRMRVYHIIDNIIFALALALFLLSIIGVICSGVALAGIPLIPALATLSIPVLYSTYIPAGVLASSLVALGISGVAAFISNRIQVMITKQEKAVTTALPTEKPRASLFNEYGMFAGATKPSGDTTKHPSLSTTPTDEKHCCGDLYGRIAEAALVAT